MQGVRQTTTRGTRILNLCRLGVSGKRSSGNKFQSGHDWYKRYSTIKSGCYRCAKHNRVLIERHSLRSSSRWFSKPQRGDMTVGVGAVFWLRSYLRFTQCCHIGCCRVLARSEQKSRLENLRVDNLF